VKIYSIVQTQSIYRLSCLIYAPHTGRHEHPPAARRARDRLQGRIVHVQSDDRGHTGHALTLHRTDDAA